MANYQRTYNYDADKVELLLKETTLNYKDIERQTGCPYSTVRYKARKLKNKTRKNTDIYPPLYSKESMKESGHVRTKPESLLTFEKKNVSLKEASQTIQQFITSAKILGEEKVNITLHWNSHEDTKQ